MNFMKSSYQTLLGRRVVKTALAVFLTALICEWIGWPPVFAVITAIVTIEPTVSDSIKKGLVRFPASAIGSAYAVLFIYLFNNSPLTYTLAAFFTIITCYRFKLHAGLLVATITAVAMVEVIHANLFMSFFTRLGTTTVGLLVSTLVNMFIFPPNYTKRIMANIQDLLTEMGEGLEAIIKQQLTHQEITPKQLEDFELLKKKLDQTNRLVNFQTDEAKYHRHTPQMERVFHYERENLDRLKWLHYHLGNLIRTPLNNLSWSEQQRTDILQMVEILVNVMKYPDRYKAEDYEQQLHHIMQQFWDSKQPNNAEYASLFTPEVIISYELASIYNIVEDILISEQEHTHERKAKSSLLKT
ncbi:FUSC family protein [Gracilibacillus alcaliphilus]|uniref:FUSC family protein n=1 Tax=Gracilibacillus alcaliphilus TaxID=1401441 RepID=UPI001EF8395F|nr:aromatic acid exporter family protein [Gracilibacillus alcaliphilus]MBM7679523.1 uncharacterized membrane protein YgaE (UPF0421/DUF939 family) [Gracilibacillus alcaliphilus]